MLLRPFDLRLRASSSMLLASLAAGCAAPVPMEQPSERTGQTRAAIQGGEVAPAASLDFAVAVVGGGLCSGTLIAPNLAVTARHCVERDPESTPPCAGGALVPPSSLRVVIGSRAAEGAPNFVVSKIIPAPETRGCVPDLALVQLAKPVPANVAKPARPAVDAEFRARPSYVGSVTAIGFGVDDVGEAGVRRIRRDIPVLCVRGDSKFDCGAEVNDFLQPFEIVAGPGACQGDSGGGLYEPKGLENDPVVLSVVSRGPIDDNGKCQEGLYVRVDPFHELLVATAKAAAAEGGYPVPAWADEKGAPAPPPPAVEAPPEPTPPPTVEPTPPTPPTTTTTTTSGCAAAPSPGQADTGLGVVGFTVALATLRARARRRRGV
jgi:hypothetical protein